MSVETLPVVYLDLTGAGWLSKAAVTRWSVERELVGSTLPGNVRGRSGLSVGSASAEVPAVGATPWSPQTATRVTGSGLPAALYAEAEDGSTHPLGDWVTAPLSGALSSGAVGVELAERPLLARKDEARLPMRTWLSTAAYTDPDPIWIVDRMAAQMGYHSVPPRTVTSVYSLPLTGSFEPEGSNGNGATSGVTDGWSDAAGTLGADNGIQITYGFDNDPDKTAIDTRWALGGRWYYTFNATGTVMFIDPFREWGFEVRAGTSQFAVSNRGLNGATNGSAWPSASYVPGQSADYPTRVQVQVERLNPTFNSSGVVVTWGALRARVRSGPSAAWSAWLTDNVAHSPFDTASTTLIVAGTTEGTAFTPGGALSGLQITYEPDAALWTAPTAVLAPLGGRVAFPWLPPDTDPWTGIQDVCAKWAAAAIVDRDGILRVLDRTTLAGAGIPGTPLDVGMDVADIDWTLDPGDTADRLEVSYVPPAVEESADAYRWGPIVWQTSEIISLGPGESRVIAAELERPANRVHTAWLAARYHAQQGSSPIFGQRNTYEVFINHLGIGGPSAETAVSFVTEVISSSRVDITIHNNTGTRQYFVDGNGDPCLILRAEQVAGLDTPALIERGVTASEAVAPLSIDLSPHVQRAEDARAIADYIWARVSTQMWRANSVRVRLDLNRDIGNIVTLSHARTGLEAKALVTKVGLDGSPEEIAQTLDLVLLPPTWGDFDAAWAGKTWAAFDAAWAAETWNDFDADPLRTEA